MAFDSPPPIAPERGVYANRTLNLRSVDAIGYDMDYTLIHYKVREWEQHAFDLARDILGQKGFPIGALRFDPEAFTIGLTFDLELGNLVKATRFGYVVQAQHGLDQITFDRQRDLYRDAVVDLSEPRFRFMNTLFELSQASLWTQLVALHDIKPLPGITSYADLYRVVDEALAETHLASSLKADIMADPGRFIDPDPDVVQTLIDQRTAGKKLLLITNSDWTYTSAMMPYAVGRFCPEGTTWRDLFDVVIVSANKPRFFSQTNPLYRVVDEERSLLHPHYGSLEAGAVYFGGNAHLVEESLGPNAGRPLYVGDHLFGDVLVSKDILRWRTALIVRELEPEIIAAHASTADRHRLESLMREKVAVDREQALLRLAAHDEPKPAAPGSEGGTGQESVKQRLAAVTRRAIDLDNQIAPLAAAASNLGNATWGPIMRAGNDKSLFARQVERYADVYTSRVSNLRYESPYAYLRAARGSLPHD